MSRVENQQTALTYYAESGNRARDTLLPRFAIHQPGPSGMLPIPFTELSITTGRFYGNNQVKNGLLGTI